MREYLCIKDAFHFTLEGIEMHLRINLSYQITFRVQLYRAFLKGNGGGIYFRR